MHFDADQQAYQALQALVAERTSPLIIWSGAGLSAQAGLPTWSELRQQLQHTLESKAKSQNDDAQAALFAQLKVIAEFDNCWLAFQKLKEALGETSFRATVREALQPASSVNIPFGYKYVWRLQPAGLLNLNLDRIATRAFSKLDADSRELTEINGFGAGDNLHIIKQHRPFVVNLHGTHNDYRSWVLTRDALNALTNNDGYQEFVRACLASKTVLFVGLSPEDTAVDGHLSRLREITRDTGNHFWITDRRDAETDAWAEDAGIRVIRYESRESDHSGLKEAFSGLLSYISEDARAPAVVREPSAELGALPDSNELVRLDANEIRQHLNAVATDILAPRTEEAYGKYAEFREEYDEAIFRAWYLSDSPGTNQLLDYTLEERVDEGAFGTVFRSSLDGEPVAVKVLHESMRNEAKALETFRRGIYSMKILERRGVSGVVPFRDAAEIPAFVVMDWVSGPTLAEAVEARLLDTWHQKLTAAVQLVRIIRKAHSLPERVLHRDIRPSNVMLRRFYVTSEIEVVVLDFDLSWHLGSIEKSVIRDSAPTSYLAPEQLQEREGVSTRHAAVDSFGLCMTLFFMIAGRRPVPSEHKHEDWKSTVVSKARESASDDWKSIPDRFARLILNGTRDKQSARWDVSQILGELELLHEALLEPREVRSAEMIAEELGARTRYAERITWDPDEYANCLTVASGARVRLSGSETEGKLELSLVWESTGEFEHRRVAKFIPSAAERATSELGKVGWNVEVNHSADRLFLTASVDAASIVEELTRHASALNAAIEALSLR